MKKIKLIGAFALASCVMLSGCDNSKKEEPSPTPGPGPAPEAGIVVGDLPDHVIVGQEYDLDQYVTVTNTESSFTITFSDDSLDLVTVDGHKVTPVGEGDISFTVSVDGKSATGSITSIYQVREDFAKFSEGIGHDYVIYYYPDSQEQVSLDVMFHTSDYLYDEQFDYEVVGYDEEGYPDVEYYPGGYAEIDGKVYSYLLEEVPGETEEDEPEFVPHFMINGDEPASIADITGAYDVDASKLAVLTYDVTAATTPWYVFNEEVLLMPKTDTASFDKIRPMIQFFDDFEDYGCTYEGTLIQSCDIEGTNEQGEEVVTPGFAFAPIVSDESGVNVWNIYIVTHESATLEEMDAFIASEETPVGKDLSSFVDIIDALVTGEFNVSIQYGSYIGDSLVSQSMAAYYKLPLGGDCTGVVNYYVSESQIHVEEVGMEDVSFGFIKGADDKIYSYGDYEEEEGPEPSPVVEPGEDVEGKFPAHTVFEFLKEFAGVEVNVPEYISSYVPASEEDYPTFEIYDDREIDGTYNLWVTSTEQEYLDFKAALEAKGWAVISEVDPEYPNDFVLRYEATPATVDLIDFIDDYGQYLVSFYAKDYFAGHYNAEEVTGAQSFADLLSYENFSFFKSETLVADPITGDVTNLYDPIFVNEITSDTFEYDFGTEESPDVHNLTTKTAYFSGETGFDLLYYLGYMPTPVVTGDRYGLADGLYTVFRAGYQWDAEMWITYTFDADEPAHLYDVTISFRVYCGNINLYGSAYPVYWGFDASFDLDGEMSIPTIDIHYPEAEEEPQSQSEPEPWTGQID
jgi:hypothetical protein